MSSGMWDKAEAFRLVDEALGAMDKAKRQLAPIGLNSTPLGREAKNALDKATVDMDDLLIAVVAVRQVAALNEEERRP